MKSIFIGSRFTRLRVCYGSAGKVQDLRLARYSLQDGGERTQPYYLWPKLELTSGEEFQVVIDDNVSPLSASLQ